MFTHTIDQSPTKTDICETFTRYSSISQVLDNSIHMGCKGRHLKQLNQKARPGACVPIHRELASEINRDDNSAQVMKEVKF